MTIKILVLSCLIFNCAASQDRPELVQHWIHSYEDDDATQEYRTYRPATYAFPPSRGRDGFEIKENGVAISHPVAPFDGNMSISEKWSLDGDDLIFTGESGVRRFRIITLTKEKLVLEQRH
jgi:hypothetical protein